MTLYIKRALSELKDLFLFIDCLYVAGFKWKHVDYHISCSINKFELNVRPWSYPVELFPLWSPCWSSSEQQLHVLELLLELLSASRCHCWCCFPPKLNWRDDFFLTSFGQKLNVIISSSNWFKDTICQIYAFHHLKWTPPLFHMLFKVYFPMPFKVMMPAATVIGSSKDEYCYCESLECSQGLNHDQYICRVKDTQHPHSLTTV